MCDQKKPLAIVIPAYKDTFFAQTMESIANQTNKDFTLYVGDDASPYNISDIVDKYKNRIDIVYKRFEENVGGKDLVAQWTRCIELTQDEEWIWLFSDDDMMQPQCVESFLNEVKNGPLYDLYRFNVNVIDKVNNVVSQCLALNKVMSSEDIYIAKQKGHMNSFVVEYIFSQEVYNKCHGFQNFDLAWNSDIATWMKFAKVKGVKTIVESSISWRSSGENITSKEDKALEKRKFNADMQFLKWVDSTFRNNVMRKFNFILRTKLVVLRYFGPIVRLIIRNLLTNKE